MKKIILLFALITVALTSHAQITIIQQDSTITSGSETLIFQHSWLSYAYNPEYLISTCGITTVCTNEYIDRELTIDLGSFEEGLKTIEQLISLCDNKDLRNNRHEVEIAGERYYIYPTTVIGQKDLWFSKPNDVLDLSYSLPRFALVKAQKILKEKQLKLITK